MEWLEVKEHALDLLANWHQELPHKWPLQIVMDAWGRTSLAIFGRNERNPPPVEENSKT